MKNISNEKAARSSALSGDAGLGVSIRAARRLKRLSQDELAGLMGVSRYTIMNWESGRSRPDADVFLHLCGLLDLPVRDLFPESPALSRLEQSVIDHLRLLKPETRDLVDAMVSAMAEKEQSARADFLRESFRLVSLQPGSLAAGTAGNGSCYVEDGPTPFFLRVSERTARADAVIRVSGHSMEPVYQDGDYVCFQRASSANPGEDVVVAWAGEQYVKRLTGGGELISINPDYPFRYDGAGDDIYITGRVLGIVASEDRPRQEDLPLLEELFSRELAGFSEKAD